MRDSSKPRSIVPTWVRRLELQELHGLAGHLRRQLWHGAFTDRQDWLLDRVFTELEYRHRHPETFTRCSCEFCVCTWEAGELFAVLDLADDTTDPF